MDVLTSSEDLSRLPGKLAERIIQLECILQEKELNEACLGDLLSAYSEAINYYWEGNNERYQLYQNKIKGLFQDLRVMNLLGEYSTKHASLNLVNTVDRAKEAAGRDAKHLLQVYETAKKRTTRQIHRQLNHQKQNILLRVRQRSLSKHKILEAVKTNIQIYGNVEDDYILSAQLQSCLTTAYSEITVDESELNSYFAARM